MILLGVSLLLLLLLVFFKVSAYIYIYVSFYFSPVISILKLVEYMCWQYDVIDRMIINQVICLMAVLLARGDIYTYLQSALIKLRLVDNSECIVYWRSYPWVNSIIYLAYGSCVTYENRETLSQGNTIGKHYMW